MMAPGMMALGGRTAVVVPGPPGGSGGRSRSRLPGAGCIWRWPTSARRAWPRRRTRPAHGVTVSRHQLDVADAEAVAALPEAVLAAHAGVAHDGVALLVNNAGVALARSTSNRWQKADFEWLFAINFLAVVRMTRAFLPVLRRIRTRRGIVNISSLFGLIAPPGQAAYSASKFAVRGFSEALRPRARRAATSGSRRSVPAVSAPASPSMRGCPARRRQAQLTRPRWRASRRALPACCKCHPEDAARIIARGVERRRARIMVGRDAKLATLVARLFPVSYWGLIGRVGRGL